MLGKGTQSPASLFDLVSLSAFTAGGSFVWMG